MLPGGSVGTGRDLLSSDSGDPDLDINRAMQMTAKLLRFVKSAPSSKHPVVIHKPQSQRPAHALTAAVAAAAEDTTGSQPQEPPKPPKAKKARKKPPAPPSPSPTPTDPAPSDSDENESAEEDANGSRKKASMTQMLDEQQEEELADWWREHPGLYDKSNETYRRKTKKDKLIAEKPRVMGVQGFDAAMLAGWMKSIRTMYGKEEKRPRGSLGLLTLSSTLGSAGWWTASNFCDLTSRLAS